MIKIQLLPPYIVERRRVKALIVLLVFVLIVEALLFMAYLWAPAPFSLATRRQKAEERRDRAWEKEQEVRQLEDDLADIQARYRSKQSWVSWVDDADSRPARYVAYFKTITDYFPADVVVNGLNLPSGNTLNLSGNTSDLMAAARWYLNMLRCEMVNTELGRNAVQFSPGSMASGAVNPRMQMPVSISVALKPEDLDSILMPVARPQAIGGGGGRGRGRMGGGGGRGGGMRGGMRGGGRRGGMRGGGGRGGGMRGGGMRGGGMRGGGMRGGGRRGF
jgi:Tfp pilus assembly protein PilN